MHTYLAMFSPHKSEKYFISINEHFDQAWKKYISQKETMAYGLRLLYIYLVFLKESNFFWLRNIFLAKFVKIEWCKNLQGSLKYIKEAFPALYPPFTEHVHKLLWEFLIIFLAFSPIPAHTTSLCEGKKMLHGTFTCRQ